MKTSFLDHQLTILVSICRYRIVQSTRIESFANPAERIGGAQMITYMIHAYATGTLVLTLCDLLRH